MKLLGMQNQAQCTHSNCSVKCSHGQLSIIWGTSSWNRIIHTIPEVTVTLVQWILLERLKKNLRPICEKSSPKRAISPMDPGVKDLSSILALSSLCSALNLLLIIIAQGFLSPLVQHHSPTSAQCSLSPSLNPSTSTLLRILCVLCVSFLIH